MLITVRGRVAMDPTAVPQAASMQTGRDDSFAQVLQQAVDGDAPTRVDERNPRSEPADEPAPAKEPEPTREREDDDEAPVAAAHAAPNDATPAGPTEAPAAADVTETIRRGEPERQATAGKGADSPRTSSSPIEPLFAAVVQYTAQSPTPATPFVPGQRGVAAVTGASATTAATRGTEMSALRSAPPLRAPAATAALRTPTPATAELFEQARDSVFQQILMKLNGDGGEMRLRLQPPELGQLDLRLVVEDGNRLTLTIAADRQDVSQLLQRHLDELKHTLQQAGLEISGASVQTRSEFAREHGGAFGRETGEGAHADVDDEPTAAVDRARLGYVSATGLDFWA